MHIKNFLLVSMFGLVYLAKVEAEFVLGSNYIRVNGAENNVELFVRNNLPDFSWAHSTPLGPLAANSWCSSGVVFLYKDKTYETPNSRVGTSSEVCYMSPSLRPINSIRLLGHKNSRIIHLWERINGLGPILRSYTTDIPNYTSILNTGSLAVVGSGVSVTFYSMHNYAGADVCVQVGTGNEIFNAILDVQSSWGFTLIKSFRFGCFSKKIINNTTSQL